MTLIKSVAAYLREQIDEDSRPLFDALILEIEAEVWRKADAEAREEVARLVDLRHADVSAALKLMHEPPACIEVMPTEPDDSEIIIGEAFVTDLRDAEIEPVPIEELPPAAQRMIEDVLPDSWGEVIDKLNGVPLGQMPEAEDVELKYLPGLNAAWVASFTPAAWEMIWRGMVAGDRPITIAARINDGATKESRVSEKAIADFCCKSGNRNIAIYLTSLSDGKRREWFRRTRTINEARYEKTMGVKA